MSQNFIFHLFITWPSTLEKTSRKWLVVEQTQWLSIILITRRSCHVNQAENHLDISRARPKLLYPWLHFIWQQHGKCHPNNLIRSLYHEGKGNYLFFNNGRFKSLRITKITLSCQMKTSITNGATIQAS